MDIDISEDADARKLFLQVPTHHAISARDLESGGSRHYPRPPCHTARSGGEGEHEPARLRAPLGHKGTEASPFDNRPLWRRWNVDPNRHYSADASRFRTFSLVSPLSAWEPINLAEFDSSFLMCVATLTVSRLSFRLRFPV